MARRFNMHACGRVISVILLTFFASPNAKAQPAEFLVVNAASYANAIAPDSLATIFGSNLAPATASATLDANGQLPTELASIREEFLGPKLPAHTQVAIAALGRPEWLIEVEAIAVL